MEAPARFCLMLLPMVEMLPFSTGRIGTLVRNALQQGLSKILISDEHVRWTGAEILELMDKLRQHLEALTQPGDPVSIVFANGAAQALATLSCLESGRIPVMLSLTDVQTDAAAWLTRARAKVVLTGDRECAQIPGYLSVIISADGHIEANSWAGATISTGPSARPSAGTLLVLFTSGSTGQPKGIFVPEEGLLRTLEFLIPYFGLGQETVSPVTLPICHSMALNTQFLPTLLAGGRSHFVDSRLNLGSLYRTILREKGSFVSLIGETLQICWQERTRRSLPPAEDVRHVQLAGGLISSRDLEMAYELFPKALVHKGYGLTEAIRVSMIDQRDTAFDSSAVGFPLPFNEVEIRDGNDVISTAGPVGEIHVRGPNVQLGAWDSPSGRVDARGFLATGDLGRWNERGQLCALGRKDGLLRIQGRWVPTLEIERAAVEASPSILAAKCIALKDPRRGAARLVLFLEIPADFRERFLTQEIRDVQERIARQWAKLPLFPREIALLQRFPHTTNGKLAVSQLGELYMGSQKVRVGESETSTSPLYFFEIGAA